MSTKTDTPRPTAWPAAAQLVARWLERRERIDALFDTLPGGLRRCRARALPALGFRRGAARESAGAGIGEVDRPSAALCDAGGAVSRGVRADRGERANTPTRGRWRGLRHAVEQAKVLASAAEARLVNAVVRRAGHGAPCANSRRTGSAPAAVLAACCSHPEWLVQRWLTNFRGAEPARTLLKWNQSPAPVYARWRDRTAPAPEFLKATAWAGFV